ncbi:hypothetical protein JXJ21_25210 [candidate division KSB1 bacterium]|nr:hypothetical protein [candidate division KSB1 bacterium]
MASSGAQSISPETITGMRFSRHIPLSADLQHVQGLSVTDNFIYITSVKTEKPQQAFLFKLNRSNGILESHCITRDQKVHPSGVQFYDGYIWHALAEYKKGGASLIQKIEPASLKIVLEFAFDDHIGAIACDKDRIYGANWDGEAIYCWTHSGELICKKEYNPGLKIQDFECIGGYLIGAGGSEGALHVLDSKSLVVLKTIVLPEIQSINRVTREGLSVYNNEFYFLPDDGLDAKIIVCKAVRTD